MDVLQRNTDKFIPCECHGHGLYMDYYICDQKQFSEIYLTPIGNTTYFEKGSIWWRIKKAWQMLRKGTMAGGEVVLSTDNAAQLVAYINDFLIKAEPS